MGAQVGYICTFFECKVLSAEYKVPRAAAHRAAHLPSTQVHGRTAEGKDLAQRDEERSKDAKGSGAKETVFMAYFHHRRARLFNPFVCTFRLKKRAIFVAIASVNRKPSPL